MMSAQIIRALRTRADELDSEAVTIRASYGSRVLQADRLKFCEDMAAEYRALADAAERPEEPGNSGRLDHKDCPQTGVHPPHAWDQGSDLWFCKGRQIPLGSQA
jgi:hypothetical protein